MLGWFSLGLGIVGVFLPVLPTVPFLLLAAFCFERGSPQWHRWMMEHKTFGPPLRQWREHRVIRPWAKAMALICISLSVTYVIYFRDINPWIKVVITGTCAVVMCFILLQKNRPPKDGEKNGI